MLQLVQGHEALVVDARKQRLERRERLVQKTEGGMTIRLVQQFAAKPFCLRPVDAAVNGRRIARGPAQGGAVRVQHDQENRRGATRASGSPGIEQGGSSRRVGGGRDDDLDGAGTLADEQTLGMEAMT